jgi:hypothetical protein
MSEEEEIPDSYAVDTVVFENKLPASSQATSNADMKMFMVGSLSSLDQRNFSSFEVFKSCQAISKFVIYENVKIARGRRSVSY